jgi:hypothetical protein
VPYSQLTNDTSEVVEEDSTDAGIVFFITVMFMMGSYPDEDDKEKDNVKNYTSEDIIDEVEMYKNGKFQYKEYTMKDGTTIKISEETNQ